MFWGDFRAPGTVKIKNPLKIGATIWPKVAKTAKDGAEFKKTFSEILLFPCAGVGRFSLLAAIAPNQSKNEQK